MDALVRIDVSMRASLLSVLTAALFRALPFVAFCLISSKTSHRQKLAFIFCFSALIGLVARLGGSVDEILVGAPLVLCYFSAVGFVAYALARRLSLPRIHPISIFSILWILAVVVPGFAIRGTAGTNAVVIGWSVALSGYSYCIDTAKSHRPPALADCLFFLLVNPVLVYAERGHANTDRQRVTKSVARLLLGLVAWLGQDLLLLALYASRGSERAFGSSYTEFLGVSSALLLATYFGQSGLASLQIGLIGVAGYRIPECYRYPLLARTPHEFWRRWNIWVGSWIRRYVYFPASLSLRRRLGPARSDAAMALAVIASFLAVGMLHDFPRYASSLREPLTAWPGPHSLVFFALCGAFLILWTGVARTKLVTGFAAALLPRRALRSVLCIGLVLHSLCVFHALASRLTSSQSVLRLAETTRK